MTKRPADQELTNSTGAAKKSKTNDATNTVIESLEKLSISSAYSFTALSSFESNKVQSAVEFRDCFNAITSQVKIFTGKDKSSENLKTALGSLKVSLLDLHSCKSEDVDIKQLFSNVFNILLKVRVCVKTEKFEDMDHFMSVEYPYKQAQLFSEQHFMRKAWINSFNYNLLDDDPVCEDEINIEARQIIECIAQIARKSKKFSQLLLTQSVDLDITQTYCSTSKKQTIIDLICIISKTIIKDQRYIAKNFGFVVAVCHLLRSLTFHYGEYSKMEDIDKVLETLFVLAMQLATYNTEIMICLLESFINIAKCPDHMRLFQSMCISHPFSNVEYSRLFRLSRMDICGCKFQILFVLLNHVFRFHEAECISGDRFDALVQITTNLNILVYTILANDVDIQFLVPHKSSEQSARNACLCYRFLLFGSLMLNSIILKNQNSSPDLHCIMKTLKRDGLIILNGILNYSWKTTAFWEVKLPQNIMNEIFVLTSCSKLVSYNDSRTSIHLVKEDDKPQDLVLDYTFLNKFDIKNRNYSASESPDRNNNTSWSSAKGLKYPEEKMSKEDLLNELFRNFKTDESVMLGYDQIIKDQ